VHTPSALHPPSPPPSRHWSTSCGNDPRRRDDASRAASYGLTTGATISVCHSGDVARRRDAPRTRSALVHPRLDYPAPIVLDHDTRSHSGSNGPPSPGKAPGRREPMECGRNGGLLCVCYAPLIGGSDRPSDKEPGRRPLDRRRRLAKRVAFAPVQAGVTGGIPASRASVVSTRPTS
jgi:hypothetical protein